MIFTMLGGEEFVTGSVLILVRTFDLLFLLFFFLDFLNTSSIFSFFHTFFFFSVLATIFLSILLTLGSTSTSATTVEEVLTWGSGEDSATLLE